MAIPRTEPPYNAEVDANQYPTNTFVSGTAGTSDVSGTAEVIRGAADPATGAQYVIDLAGGAGTTNIQGSVTIIGGTIGSVVGVGTLSNIGSLSSIGTLIGVGTQTNLGSVTNIGQVHNSGTVQTIIGGTIDQLSNIIAGTQNILGTVGTLNGIGPGDNNIGNVDIITGTVTRVSNVGTLERGTVVLTNKPTPAITLYGTVGTAGTAFWGTIAAAGGVGTSHFVNDLSIVVTSGNVDCMVAYGTALVGSGVLARGVFSEGLGIEKSFVKSPGGNNTNTSLVYYLGGAGTVSFNMSYWTELA